MMENKKAAPTVGAVESGKGQTLLTGFKPMNDVITDFDPAQGSIASFLGRGKENALTAKEISKITGLPERKVTLKICAERRQGAPILSDNRNGFWLATDETELIDCVHRLHARAAQIHKTAQALEKRYG